MKATVLTFIHVLLFTFILNVNAAPKCSVIPENLQCEYLAHPSGLDVPFPRFSWTLQASNENSFGQRQTAYRILVSQTEKKINKGVGDMWDSGWIGSDLMQLIEYGGKPLHSDRDYYWKVCVKDESGNESKWSETAHWSTGLFASTDWKAKWIGTSDIFDPSKPECNLVDPWFRKTIQLNKKPVRATMFIASVGYHELYVNGKKIGDHVLAPAVSDHTTRARYIAYDIAKELKPGKNVIALWLGTSWAIFDPYKTSDKPRSAIVIAQADVYYDKEISADSKPAERIITDETWKTHPSPNKLLGKWGMGTMGGELYDANKEIPDWNQPTFNDSDWTTATVFSPRLKLSAQNAQVNKKFEEITPVSIEERPDGSYRVDMGVNFAGWTNIKVTGNPGDRVDFLFSEREQHEMTFRNYSAYIIGPSGKGTFNNRFNYSSGRWITIKGLKEKPQLSDIKGWLVRTDYPSATDFKCSNDLQNWMYDRIRWTFENLSIGGYIVDCPQRERLGYGGDAHATSETGLFNYSLGSFYTKWMQDWRDVQGWETNMGPRVGGGVLPHTAPTNNGGGGPSWGGIVVTLPWFIYQHEGDTRILRENFELIVKWMDFLKGHTKNDILVRWGGNWDYLADWLWPGATAEGMNNNKPQAECFNSCYYVFNLSTAANIARVLGENEKAAEWDQRAEAVRKAVHVKYYNADDFSYSDRSMGNLAVALLANIPPAGLKDKVMERLEKEILVNCKGHINVGITGGAMLFKLLRELGRDDLIYSMTSQTTYPSWGFMRENDATTIWEMWEKDLPGHSLLHSSYLYPGAWYIDGVAGIRRNPDYPGFRKFIIRPPMIDESNISWANASYNSPVGKITTDWKRENGRLSLKVKVPPNSSALVYFPAKGVEKSGHAKKIEEKDGYVIYEVPAGKYEFNHE
ncbi:MAG: glycoside hydrolase family 78 protein [Bacteroidales bacterium]|jgi:alpha-L-rhamnosidase|nr:glycoside hydrolase family 78 protein [Bacteroidales bacterium]